MATAYVASTARVASSITHLISVEVIKGLISTRRMWTDITVMWIEVIINVSAEVVGSVEPRAGTDEYTAVEPLGTVVPIWGAAIRSVVVEAIWANRLWSDIDGHLGGCGAWDAQQRGNQGGKGKDFPVVHKFSPHFGKRQPKYQSSNGLEEAEIEGRARKTEQMPKMIGSER
jgi:hypothetical protein